jgi:hypothetical protein
MFGKKPPDDDERERNPFADNEGWASPPVRPPWLPSGWTGVILGVLAVLGYIAYATWEAGFFSPLG